MIPTKKSILKQGVVGLAMLVTSILIPACTYDQLTFQPDCEGVIILEVVGVQASACDQAAGRIEVKVTDANLTSVTYSIDGTTFQSEGVFENLSAGSYTITARTADCEQSLDIQVDNAEGLNATATTAATVCGASTGAITINTTNAVGELTYQLNGGAAQSSNVFNGLAAGSYDLAVADANGCEVGLSVTVGTDVQFATIETIINNSCALGGCHAGNVSPDFRVKDNILNNANQIKNRTTAQTMPPASSGISLTPQQIEAIQCWVDDGAEG